MTRVNTLSTFNNEVLLHYHSTNPLHPAKALQLTLAIIELLSDDVTDTFLLKFLTRFLTPEAYTEMTQERVINKLCAYPLCAEEPGRIKDAFSGSFKKSGMLPYSYLNSYCSKYHFQCSEFYKKQLDEEALFARSSDVTVAGYGTLRYEVNMTLLEEIVNKYNNRTNPDETMADILRGLTTLDLDKDKKEEQVEAMTQLFHDFEIVENEPEPPKQEEKVQSYEYLQDQSKAIDGYVFDGKN